MRAATGTARDILDPISTYINMTSPPNAEIIRHASDTLIRMVETHRAKENDQIRRIVRLLRLEALQPISSSDGNNNPFAEITPQKREPVIVDLQDSDNASDDDDEKSQDGIQHSF